MTTGNGVGVAALWFDPAGVDADAALCNPDLDEAQQAAAAALASDILYVLTNRKWIGTAARSVRPAFQARQGLSCWGWWNPVNPDPRFPLGWATPFRPYVDAVRASTLMRLPGPVTSITRIKVDGTDLPTGSYALVGERTVQRLDGEDWPTTNDLTRAATTPRGDATEPAWQVDYVWGRMPPAGGEIMAEILYCEIAKAIAGAADCRLVWGGRMTTVNRRGVTLSFESISQFLEKGLTGIDEVDIWVNTVRGGRWRPNGGPRVLRADAVDRSRTRWTA